MVRRSAGQRHNLSQDMIAGTISQANYCFSISTNQEPKSSTKLSSNNQVRQITQTSGTHNKIEIQNKMDAIHGKLNQQAIQH
jgi:hypothetical protein